MQYPLINSTICTLFEGDYHLGVAALSNSLYKAGYRGAIYAGYKGSLPQWATKLAKPGLSAWHGSSTVEIQDGLLLHFLPIVTESHLTNYKPDFMLCLVNETAKHNNAIFYFDPDIIVTAEWHCFEKWVSCGIALCEDINSPLPEHHPRRWAWRRYLGEKNISLEFKEAVYANGGFIGLTYDNNRFLEIWKTIQDLMGKSIGGLSKSSLNGPGLPENSRGPFAPFPKTDQDALNAAVEASAECVSFVGKDGMSFESGASLMSHALGPNKPWKSKYFRRLLLGEPPRIVDKQYWKNVKEPIQIHEANTIVRKQLALKISAFLGRFYRRN